MLRGSFRLIAPGLTLAIVVGASGCSSSGDKPRTLPPVSNTPVTTSVAPMPSGLNAASAEAFVRDLYAEYNRAANTGDTTRLATLMSTDCPCRAFLDFVASKYRTGRLQGADYRLDKVGPTHLDGKGAGVQIVYSLPPLHELDKSGRVIKVEKAASRVPGVVFVAWQSGRWQIVSERDLPQ